MAGKKEKWVITWEFVNVDRQGSGPRGVDYPTKESALASAKNIQKREARNGMNGRFTISHFEGVRTVTLLDVEVIEPLTQELLDALIAQGEKIDAEEVAESLKIPLVTIERHEARYASDCQLCPWKDGVHRDRVINEVRFVSSRGGGWGWGATYCDEHLDALIAQLEEYRQRRHEVQ